jgi:hypothetical protein
MIDVALTGIVAVEVAINPADVDGRKHREEQGAAAL